MYSPVISEIRIIFLDILRPVSLDTRWRCLVSLSDHKSQRSIAAEGGGEWPAGNEITSSLLWQNYHYYYYFLHHWWCLIHRLEIFLPNLASLRSEGEHVAPSTLQGFVWRDKYLQSLSPGGSLHPLTLLPSPRCLRQGLTILYLPLKTK